MNTTFKSFIVIAMPASSLAAQAAWDMTVASNNSDTFTHPLIHTPLTATCASPAK